MKLDREQISEILSPGCLIMPIQSEKFGRIGPKGNILENTLQNHCMYWQNSFKGPARIHVIL